MGSSHGNESRVRTLNVDEPRLHREDVVIQKKRDSGLGHGHNDANQVLISGCNRKVIQANVSPRLEDRKGNPT